MFVNQFLLVLSLLFWCIRKMDHNACTSIVNAITFQYCHPIPRLDNMLDVTPPYNNNNKQTSKLKSKHNYYNTSV
jgi:hypothetical protein